MNWKLSNYCLAFLLLLSSLSHAQSGKLPKDIKQAVSYLYLECPDSLKKVVKQTEPKRLKQLVYPSSDNLKVLFYWLNGDNNNSPKLVKYLKSRGIVNYQDEVILSAFRNHLLTGNENEQDVLEFYIKKEKKKAAENAVRFTTDSLNGVYIPKNLEECFTQINSFWPDSTRNIVREWTEDKFTANTHFDLGMWMRNNWGLWAGSRLSTYFRELKIHHPDDMSGIILTSYHRRLNNRDIDLQQQVAGNKEYYKSSEDGRLLLKMADFAAYKLGDTVLFSYKYGFSDEKQEAEYDNERCTAKGIITGTNSKDFLIRVKVIESCGSNGIIYYNNEETRVLNKKTQMLEKPKKRVILRIKSGRQYWSSYSDWETIDQ